MNPSELLKAGKLSEARTLLTERVKSSPTDTAARTLLFQALAFQGEWDKAERQLDILAMQKIQAETGVQVYKNLISAEKERLEISRGLRIPSFMTAVPVYFETVLAFREQLRNGNQKEAKKIFKQMEKQVEEISGSAQGQPFSGFKDMDSSMAHFLEIIVHEHCLWIPVSSIRELSIQPPSTLLDLLWAPARIVTWEGLTTNCFIPVLYPDSASHGNDLVCMGRITDWIDYGGGFYRGLGQHLYLVGDEEKALLELRDIIFNPAGSRVAS
jgi:type VI secretion system protein ImpE